MNTMNYVELTYNALNATYGAKAEEKRFQVIKLMNDGGSIEEIDMAIEEWALAIQKGQLLNSMVDKKDETQTQTSQEQSGGIAPPTE